MKKMKLQKLHNLNDKIRELIENRRVPLYIIHDLMEASSRLELHNKYETINQDTALKLSELGFSIKEKAVSYIITF